METNAIYCRAQVHDVLLAMLRANRAPTVEHLLSLAPPEPLGPPEGNMMVQQKGVGWIGGERKRWPKSVIKLSEKYPGYQPGYEYREALKYGYRSSLAKPHHAMPAADDPLASFVRKRIQHARVLWSKDIDAKRTELQFEDWLPLHVDFQTDIKVLWPENDGSGWDLSLQLLRLACGLPRFATQVPRGSKK